MTEFAKVLAENGISVLTFDKRGIGESGGIYAGPEVGTNNIDSLNLNRLAKDASAAVNILHQQKQKYTYRSYWFQSSRMDNPNCCKYEIR